MYDVLMCSWVQDDYKYGGRIHVERLLFVPKGKHPYVTEHAFFDKNKKKIAVQKSRKHVLPDSVSDLLGTTLSFRQFVAKRKQSPLHKRIESTADHCQKTKSFFLEKNVPKNCTSWTHSGCVVIMFATPVFFNRKKMLSHAQVARRYHRSNLHRMTPLSNLPIILDFANSPGGRWDPSLGQMERECQFTVPRPM
jgi:hypothetical protein